MVGRTSRGDPPVTEEGTDGDHGPPPSTYAARLVQLHTRNGLEQHGEPAEVFAEFLQKIIIGQKEPETELDVNYRLIRIVVRYASDFLNTSNPFTRWPAILEMAGDAITVIEITLQRQPQLLFFGENSKPHGNAGPSLLVWLFAKMVHAATLPHCDDLQPAVSRLLVKIIQLLRGTLSLREHLRDTRQMYVDAVDDLLGPWTTQGRASAISIKSLDVTLPPARSISRLLFDSPNATTISSEAQVHINTPRSAFVASVVLIEALLQLEQNARISNVPTMTDSWMTEAASTALVLVVRHRDLFESADDFAAITHSTLATVLQLLPYAGSFRGLLHDCAIVLIQAHLHKPLEARTQSQLTILIKALDEDSSDPAAADIVLATHSRDVIMTNVKDSSPALRKKLQDWLGLHDPQNGAYEDVDMPDACALPTPDVSSGSWYQQLAANIADLFGNRSSGMQACLSLVTVKSYLQLESEKQELLWITLSCIPCAATGTSFRGDCLICDHDQRLSSRSERAEWVDPTMEEKLLQTLQRLLASSDMQSTPRCRVLAAMAVRACLLHARNARYLDLGKSELSKWCLKSTKSSLRDLRIASSRALMAYLREDLPVDLRDKNRIQTLEYLRDLSVNAAPGREETVIYAWGQIAVICGDRERNLALLQLVDYLGHTRPLTCAFAIYELEKVGQTMQQPLQVLFRPYWRTIAVSVVRDLLSKPQKMQLLIEMLDITQNKFLTLTQTDTVPHLVLTRRKDILERIAAARGPGTAVQEVVLQPQGNLAGVLALLLSQASDDPETFMAAILSDMIPGVSRDEIHHLLHIDLVGVAVELLKLAGDEDAGRKELVHKAIHHFVLLKDRKMHVSNSSAASLMARFFEVHILGIMTQISEKIEAKGDVVVVQEKVRCLQALEEMIHLATTHVSAALPQIRACLQSAIDQGGLVDPSVSAWLSLMHQLPGDDAVQLLDHLFSVVLQNWSDMSSGLQQRTHDTIAQLIKANNQAITAQVTMVPSLSSIPLLSKFAAEIARTKQTAASPLILLESFVKRLQDENAPIVLQAGVDLQEWLEEYQAFVHDGATSEPPAPIVSAITRALLDACVKYNASKPAVADVCSRCLGIIGCLDPNRIEANVTDKQILVMSDFELAREVLDWVICLFRDILVPAFESAGNARIQGFLAYVIQELIKFAEFENPETSRLRSSQTGPATEAYNQLPQHVKNTLTPFFDSRYVVTVSSSVKVVHYPIFKSTVDHGFWLRTWVLDMLNHGKGENAKRIFSILARVIMGHDLAIAKFLLPYVALNNVLGGDVREVGQVSQEMLVVLSTESTAPAEMEVLRQCSENVFLVLDYMTRWAQSKKQTMAQTKLALLRAGHSMDEMEEVTTLGQIQSVENVINSIPANIIAQRAIECGSYARALFHWENFIRERMSHPTFHEDKDAIYARLQTIYSEIDEPDGLDGIAAQISVLTPEQQAFQHLRAGRWSAAQSWYEIELLSRPEDHGLQMGLLSCLQESGQANQVLRTAQDAISRSGGSKSVSQKQQLLSFVAEAAWSTDRLEEFAKDLQEAHAAPTATNFNISLGLILNGIDKNDISGVATQIDRLRCSITRTLSAASASSLSACHTQMLQLHALYEVERMSALRAASPDEAQLKKLAASFDKRLLVLNSSTANKLTLLAIRRAGMAATRGPFLGEKGKSWLATAHIARKTDAITIAHYAVVSAAKCGDQSSRIEQARLLWKAGHHRQAVQHLQGTISSSSFISAEQHSTEAPPLLSEGPTIKQNMLAARANLLLAKWLDASGQSQTTDTTQRYQLAAKNYAKWEKGHYYLGKHYNKLLEAERTLPVGKQSDAYMTGELTKLVIENYLRSIPFGAKYWYQTIPKLITLWLDLGMECLTKPKELSNDFFERRTKMLGAVHNQIKKYFDRIPPYVFYSALPQLISRISHPNKSVAGYISMMISRIVMTFPAQTLWSLLPVAKASAPDRAARGKEIIAKLRDPKPRAGVSEAYSLEIRTMVLQGQKLQDGLLNACDIHIEGRTANVSLSRDLGFSHKLAPSSLVVPFQHLLTPNIPTVHDSQYIRTFKPFAHERVTIAHFSDDVLVLNSLQRPRKLTLRGSDGKSYGLLCKPKDDLRKDQRLMEFNTMINRALKRNAEASKRRLYIKTYGVTPLSEESGAIEWVEGIKPLRDILLKLYQRKGIAPNYTEIRAQLAEACAHESKHHLFTTRILPGFPPILHEWFTELFPSPSAWFASRLRYARSAAVMSMVGHVLGLGDRHGENILLEEHTGGVFHVDFNCLFDKGLTFDKPELVPFRLTHNMVDAMGPALRGDDGPFRASAELTLTLLRQHQDTLMNILETFLHDPTTDFIGAAAAAGRKRKAAQQQHSRLAVPETPQEVLDSVSAKLRGFLRGESVPLGVEGQVQALVRMARDEGNLCKMYIGWCAFF